VSPERFTLPAHAKINLSLRVLGKRADGFHEIRTIFQTITLHDLLTFETRAGEGFELECTTEGIPVDETNLVTRAARALRECYGVRKGARVMLEKRIPSQAGLGGGSTDAAAALLGLSRLWEIETTRVELDEIGARLGADVPFFFTGGTALGTGLGTEITPLADVAERPLVVVMPDARVSTVEAYKLLNARTLTKPESPVNLPISRVEAQNSVSLYEDLRNDFEPVIFRLQPEIERARDALLAAGAQSALLAGSGASVFGIFENRAEAERAREVLARAEAGWQVFACETLSREGYMDALGACARYVERGA
jgi:4-diphosphocytidyl-2-C-methyl-D-erythritol kinase